MLLYATFADTSASFHHGCSVSGTEVPECAELATCVLKRMATALNTAAGVSAASEAFRKCSADLIRGIQDPELLAWELYSDDVVSETVVDEVSVVGLSGVQRKTRLLSAVRDQIAIDPAKFQNLLLALRKQPPLKDVADKLETIYNNCGM